MKKCPECGAESFVVTAHVTQDWVVDGNGNFLSCQNDCVEVTHKPDNDDIWSCANCEWSGPGCDAECNSENTPLKSVVFIDYIFISEDTHSYYYTECVCDELEGYSCTCNNASELEYELNDILKDYNKDSMLHRNGRRKLYVFRGTDKEVQNKIESVKRGKAW